MSDGFDPTTIENRIRAFESFGIHRTGWPGDDETGRWLVSELAAVGVEAKTERFTFPRIEHRAARLTTPDGVIEGLPMYDGGSTPSGGLVGQLVSVADSDRFGNIVVAMPHDDGFDGFTGPATQATIQQLEADGVVAAILVSGDEDGEIIVRNAELIDHPFDLPVLQIAMKDAGDLATAILMNIEGTLEIEAERLDSTATNVVATLPGTDADAAPVGVMTPRSGWFTCAAERGGGIAVWLALAEALAATPRQRPIELLASSGHELHHYGAAAYLKERPTLAKGAAAWLHLGASIGARVQPVLKMDASDQQLLDLAASSLSASGAAEREVIGVGGPSGGEARNIADAGGRYVSFRGPHAFFHSPQDGFARAVDAESVALNAKAALAIVEGMIALD